MPRTVVAQGPRPAGARPPSRFRRLAAAMRLAALGRTPRSRMDNAAVSRNGGAFGLIRSDKRTRAAPFNAANGLESRVSRGSPMKNRPKKLPERHLRGVRRSSSWY